MGNFKDGSHLLRLAGVYVAGTLLFLVVRAFVVPHSFGQYGHYRGAAISEIAAHPAKFAGHQTCETCHTDVAQTKSAGKHAGVNCEACHGPQAKHADDPASLDPGKPDTAVLCVQCHAASAARPKDFPQVNADEHSGGAPCGTCHQPHSPVIAAGGRQ
jgi:hypothetical protein